MTNFMTSSPSLWCDMSGSRRTMSSRVCPSRASWGQLRALGKEGEASTAGVMQRGAAAMAWGPDPFCLQARHQTYVRSCGRRVRVDDAAVSVLGYTVYGDDWKEAFRRALATCTSRPRPEADAIFAALDAGTGTLAYAELGVALARLSPSRASSIGRARRRPSAAPASGASARSSYVTEMIVPRRGLLSARGGRCHTPEHKGGALRQDLPRARARAIAHDRGVPLLPEIPPRTTEESPEKSLRRKAAIRDRAETVVPRDSLTGEMPKPAPEPAHQAKGHQDAETER